MARDFDLNAHVESALHNGEIHPHMAIGCVLFYCDGSQKTVLAPDYFDIVDNLMDEDKLDEMGVDGAKLIYSVPSITLLIESITERILQSIPEDEL